jgi:hypothetical protein
MSEKLKAVRDKAGADVAFAKELFINPTNACMTAGIDLNRTEIKILGDAMSEVREYFAEKLDLITQPPEDKPIVEP